MAAITGLFAASPEQFWSIPISELTKESTARVKRNITLAGTNSIVPFVASAQTSEYGKLTTVIEIANVSGSEVRLSYRFHGSDGRPILMPVQEQGCESCSTLTSTAQATLGPYRGGRIVILAQDPVKIGWAEVTADREASLSVSATLRSEAADGSVDRSSVPLAPQYSKAWLYTDNGSEASTSLVLVNPDASRSRNYQLQHRSFLDQAFTCQVRVQVAALGQVIVNTAEALPCSSGGLGILEISGDSDGRRSVSGAALVQHADGSAFFRQLIELPGTEKIVPLQAWSVSPGMVRFGPDRSAGCITVRNKVIGGAMHTVNSSKWQKWDSSRREWLDVAGTVQNGMVCSYVPESSAIQQFRGVAEIEIDGRKGLYASANVLISSASTPAAIPPVPLGVFNIDESIPDAKGIAFGNNRYYIISQRDERVYAHLISGERDPESDFGLDPDLQWPGRIEYANNRFFVLDTFRKSVSSYFISGEVDSEFSFDADDDYGRVMGISAGNGRLYIVDQNQVYAHFISGERDFASDFDLDSENRFPTAIAFGNDRLYVTDRSDDKVYAYLVSGERDPTSDFELHDIHVIPEGMAFSNGGFYIIDSFGADKILAYFPSSGLGLGGNLYRPLDLWTIAEGQVQFSGRVSGQCVTPGTVGGMTYTVESSGWQRRDAAGQAWSDIPGTERSGMLCAYSPTQPGQYRAVATIAVDGAKEGYSSRNVLVVEGQSGSQPDFGTATVAAQTYTAGTPISPLTLPAASGGDAPVNYSLAPSVPGLTFDSGARRLTGTPSSADSYAMTYRARDADGDTDTIQFTIRVDSASTPGDDGGSGTNSFDVGDAITDMPSGFWVPSHVETGKGASFRFSGGRTTIAWTTADGIVEYDGRIRWTCASSGGCEVVNRRVTKGTVVQLGG